MSAVIFLVTTSSLQILTVLVQLWGTEAVDVGPEGSQRSIDPPAPELAASL